MSLQTFSLIIGVVVAVPLAAKSIHWTFQKLVRGAGLVVRVQKAVNIILYELAPNEGHSLVDAVHRIEQTLENHLVDHHRFDEPAGTPDGF